jgi:Cft2 family RNA processing exonuclease
MFHYDRGLKLTKADLAVDFRRRQPRAFVSHAHVDHMARHEWALCTPATSALYQKRYGPRPTRELPYRQPLAWGGLRLTTYPAGHCLGSAMLLAEDGERSLLYTGDFKLGESATAVRAELPRADVLVIESTYGQPLYRHPPRQGVLDQLFSLVKHTLDSGATPVVEAYVLGKSQEVTRLLTLAGFPVLQHPKIFEISQVYRACGVDLGDCHRYGGEPLAGHVVVVPPRMHRAGLLPGLRKTVTFAVTGWATHERTRGRLGVDHAIPLSDHADYDELFEAVERVQPKTIYCTHGPVSFVDCLRKAGHNAHPLERQVASAAAPARQLPLF